MLKHSAAAKKFYNSTAWRKCRAVFFEMKHGLCERCDEPGKIVHHKTHINHKNINDPMITLNHDNLELLCQECHNREHFEKYSPVPMGCEFDDDGNLIELKRV